MSGCPKPTLRGKTLTPERIGILTQQLSIINFLGGKVREVVEPAATGMKDFESREGREREKQPNKKE